MSVHGKKVVQMGGQRLSRTSCVSPKALYARPMALRDLYTDAGSVIRRGQQEARIAAAAERTDNSR
ncbi:hypothetical protein LWP59_03230 [Amycolatopsis acidiphila]|uniref:Uncharacterized protein n=1 Tax=Amycolatopsis acidiphila TaxID=715473 RepID=A0A558A0Y6_9PSEU|nr:hypothetical protein [Amycolatopsis acidiphila]TVT17920.1 hypothetical protein FNH06_29790 [Amycolatopsis acidiphila]UIJ60711.1 hypothetical protein LWP59_03230 [Amycolatopsis acidiphila]GHG91285.1 hypothetical protein GCM10017788_67440 [Amycolatopsis acidiphila]